LLVVSFAIGTFFFGLTGLGLNALPGGPSFCFAKKKQKGDSRETEWFLLKISSF